MFLLGLVGLAISYTLSATNQLGGVVTSFTETEKEMVSVERAVQYIRGTPSERTRGSCKVSSEHMHSPLPHASGENAWLNEPMSSKL